MTKAEAKEQILAGNIITNGSYSYEYKKCGKFLKLTDKHIHKCSSGTKDYPCDFENTEPNNSNYTL